MQDRYTRALAGFLTLLLFFSLQLPANVRLEPLELPVRVIGTASFQDRAVALIEDQASGLQAFYRPGDTIYGYQVTTVEPLRVILSREGKQYFLAVQPQILITEPSEEPSATPKPRPNIYGETIPRRPTPTFYGVRPPSAQWDAWAPKPAPPATALRAELGGRFAFPLERYKRLSSPFGYRRHPIRGGVRMHTGIDLASWTGTKIFAADSGTVIRAGWMGGYGYCVMIDHHNGYVTVYGHCSKILVDVGDNVRRGDYIAQVGSTGASTGPHLHFEVRRNGTPINPAGFFPRL